MKSFKLEEAYVECGVSQELILQYIKEDWVHPAQPDSTILDEEDLARIKLIHQLREEFGVNPEAMDIILNLLDQLNRVYLEFERYSRRAH